MHLRPGWLNADPPERVRLERSVTLHSPILELPTPIQNGNTSEAKWKAATRGGSARQVRPLKEQSD
ncbi:hypothetical protein CSV67_08670 [Sporosarcina sp. P2]|nr:hypothetical protein CSV67_08670 [Sporosarcina sp. P2]PID23349.1 hypothetical protein CSV60_15295 [Sporosarcina sp. P7]